MSCFMAGAQETSPGRVLRRVGDFWGIPGEQRNQPHAIHYDVFVTFRDPQWRNFWFSLDGYPGYLPLSPRAPELPVGRRILITGTIIPNAGLEADRVKVTVLDDPAAPPPLDLKGKVGDIWQFDQKLITTEAYVDQQLLVDSHHLRLYLIIEHRPVIGWVWLNGDTSSLPNFSGKYVRLNAVYSARSDPSGTATDIELWCAGIPSIRVLHDIADEALFAREATPIAKIFQTPPGTDVLVRGRAQQQVTGSSVTVRDATGQITVLTVQEQRVPVGSEIEVVGTTSPFGTAWTLHPSLFRIRPSSQSLPADPTPDQDPLDWVEDVRQLSGDEAGAARKVRLKGVITWSQPDQSYLFLQDVSGGIRVRFKPGSVHLPIIGKHVIIEGTTYQAPVGPAVDLQRVIDQGSMRLPQHRSVGFEQAMTGSEDGQWVELRGYLRKHDIRAGRTYMEVITTAGHFTACIQTEEKLDHLHNALIRIRGVCDTATDADGRVTGFTLWVPYLHSISVDEDAPENLFNLPLRSISHLRQLSASPSIRRVRLAGVVAHHVTGDHLYVQQGAQGIMVLSDEMTALLPGDQVEVVGLLGRQGRRTVVRAATYRRNGAASPPEPLHITSFDHGLENMDASLVAARGLLVNVFPQPTSTRLTLQSGSTLFEATLAGDGAPQWTPDLALGTGIEVIGVFRAPLDDTRLAAGYEIELRSPDDVRVYQKPRLLTLQRAVTAATLLGGIAVLGLLWASALRRRVHRQTEQIRSQLERQGLLEDRHRSIVENASDVILTTDLEGHITTLNPAGERLTGFSQQDAKRMTLRELVVPESEAPLLLNPSEYPNEKTVTFQARLRTREGRLIWIECNARLVRAGDGTAGLLGIVRDISERKIVEDELKRARDAAEAATRAKSEFLANMSHEIRTPMNAVIGMSNLLLDTRLDERQREFARTIRDGAEALLTVLNDILDFSKIEAGRLQMEILDFDLREVMENAVGLMAPRAVDKGLDLALLIAADAPCAVRGDPGRLRQVVLNLLGNAVKFTENGEVFVQVSCSNESPGGASYRFEFTDTGVGMSAAQQARLFQPFAQADTSTTRRFGGTGLGLAISKQIVQLMGGECGVSSELGRGSTFWFTLPLVRRLNVAGTKEPFDRALPPLRVLIAEASAGSRRVLHSYAQAMGLRVDAAETFEAALGLLNTGAANGDPFEVLVVHDAFPEHVRFELIERIGGMPELLNLRIVACSQPNQPAQVPGLYRQNQPIPLMKPIRLDDFVFAIRSAATAVNTAPSPAATPAQGSSAGSSNPLRDSRPPREATNALRVLVAEDNLVNQRVVLLQLQKLGHHAKAVGNGKEVIQALTQAEYDLILMDCQMPEMDGYEAAIRIRAGNTQADLPIIALTADAMQGAREKCFASGMNDYLSKPIRIGELQSALARHARSSKLSGQ